MYQPKRPLPSANAGIVARNALAPYVSLPKRAHDHAMHLLDSIDGTCTTCALRKAVA